jgi:transketolase
MGDQIGTPLTGELWYIPRSEISKVLSHDIDSRDKAKIFATIARLNALYMIAKAGSGHIGSSFSSLDVVCWILLNELGATDRIVNPNGGIYFSSKGHDVPGYYSALIGLGLLEEDKLNQLRRLNGLPGHPDVRTVGVEVNSGSLGMGVSKAKGMVKANRLEKVDENIFVLCGDGELQEGQIWESLQSASNHKLHEITLIVDHNKLQSDIYVECVNDLGDLTYKFSSFGWDVQEIDGHSHNEIKSALKKANSNTEQPSVIIAHTVKGKGVSFMEHNRFGPDEIYPYHSGAPVQEEYNRAVAELWKTVRVECERSGVEDISYVSVRRNAPVSSGNNSSEKIQCLVDAYGDELLALAKENKDVVVLDADLALDTGILLFKEELPDRFLECGIAEQDMVSQAGGLALKGKIPVLHSFSCFLSTRPNEQIYNNATEKTKVIYVGSLSGILPAGPGHSHQSVRDISILGAIPGLVMIAPATEQEARAAIRWAVENNETSTYIRLESVPTELPSSTAVNSIKPGRGDIIAEGDEVAVVTYGPTMMKEALKTRRLLLEMGIGVKVINLPWLNRFDTEWLASRLQGIRLLATMDNHYVRGGQGDYLLADMARNGHLSVDSIGFGLRDIPECGRNEEVLEHHGLSAKAMSSAIFKYLDDK